MDELDYWRLCEELNVAQAALLVVGEVPTYWQFVENWETNKRPKGYDASRTAIVHALKKYVLYQSAERLEAWPSDLEYLNILKIRSIEGVLIPEYETDINGYPTIAIAGSVDVYRSTVEVESLKCWLKNRGFTSGFFFPAGNSDAPDYLDPKNPRFAPKLAAAVHAWQAVTDPGKKSPKQALEKWLREHAARFGLVDDDGNPVNQAVEDCSKVANWNSMGGAPKTPSA